MVLHYVHLHSHLFVEAASARRAAAATGVEMRVSRLLLYPLQYSCRRALLSKQKRAPFGRSEPRRTRREERSNKKLRRERERLRGCVSLSLSGVCVQLSAFQRALIVGRFYNCHRKQDFSEIQSDIPCFGSATTVLHLGISFI